MVLDSWSSCPSSQCHASCASTSAVTRLRGMMGRSCSSRGSAMKAGKSWSPRGVGRRTLVDGLSAWSVVMAMMEQCETSTFARGVLRERGEGSAPHRRPSHGAKTGVCAGRGKMICGLWRKNPRLPEPTSEDTRAVPSPPLKQQDTYGTCVGMEPGVPGPWGPCLGAGYLPSHQSLSRTVPPVLAGVPLEGCGGVCHTDWLRLLPVPREHLLPGRGWRQAQPRAPPVSGPHRVRRRYGLPKRRLRKRL